VIDFVTVVAEPVVSGKCIEGGRDEFIDKSVKILPLLYLKIAVESSGTVFGMGQSVLSPKMIICL
jgi:hypothetical protein